jgi:hypothetical protein
MLELLCDNCGVERQAVKGNRAQASLAKARQMRAIPSHQRTEVV